MTQPSSHAASAPFDAIVVGGGPAGLATAIALAEEGARTALVARRETYPDNRTTALLGASVDMLRRYGVWQHCADRAARLAVMRLVDDTNRLIRAPEVVFHASEIGIDTFGYNVENSVLVEAMEKRADASALLTRFDTLAAAVEHGEAHVTVRTDAGEVLTAAIVIGADGRNSACREAAGITMSWRPLNQAAVTFNVRHTRPHRDESTEFHTRDGQCVFVPMPGNEAHPHRSSVVWVVRPHEAERLAALSDDELSVAIERQSHSVYGAMTVEPGRFSFPLAIAEPSSLAQNRIALVGEAAHVAPPVGAQGLNLSLRDGAQIADIVTAALAQGDDPGSEYQLASYRRSRRLDIIERVIGIDMANRSLISEYLPVQAVRAMAMAAIGSFGPLRRLVMREGVSPIMGLPRLMRETSPI